MKAVVRGRSGRIAHLTFIRIKKYTKCKPKHRKFTPREATLCVLSLKLVSPKKVIQSNSYWPKFINARS